MPVIIYSILKLINDTTEIIYNTIKPLKCYTNAINYEVNLILLTSYIFYKVGASIKTFLINFILHLTPTILNNCYAN